MKYVLLLHFPDTYMGETWSPQQLADHQRAYADYKQRLLDDGVFLSGEALQSADITTSITVRNGDVITTDGPYVESTEQIGGYYLCECRDLDHAIAVAAGIPGAAHGTIEIRPVFDYEALVE